MTWLGRYWNCFDNQGARPYHHTISATLVYGLREALAQLAEEGLVNCWARHAQVTDKFHEGLVKRGYRFFVKQPQHRLKTVSAIMLPDGVEAPLVIRYAMDRWWHISSSSYSLDWRAFRFVVLIFLSCYFIWSVFIVLCSSGFSYIDLVGKKAIWLHRSLRIIKTASYIKTYLDCVKKLVYKSLFYAQETNLSLSRIDFLHFIRVTNARFSSYF